MKVLVLCGHVREGSLCAALAAAYAAGARAAGCHVREISLADLQFDPDVHPVSPAQQPLEPDLQHTLAALEWAQHLVLVFPSWWGFAPARLKGLLDRILLPGRAFRETPSGAIDGLLGGRTAHLLSTVDMPPWVYRWIHRGAGQRLLQRSVLGLCGIRCTRSVAFGASNHSSAAQRADWVQRAHGLGFSLRHGALRRRQRVADAFVAWLRALRLQFFPMSWLAYTLGAFSAEAAGHGWDRRTYWLGYASLFFIKAATVLVNERFDFDSDRINEHAGAFNGGSRVLVDGSLSVTQMHRGTLALLACGVLCAALTLSAAGGTAALVVLAFSTVAALGYTAPPLRLSWRGFGEIDVALTHSIGVLLWGYVLQGGHWNDATPWLLSLPLALAVLPSIVLSSIPDMPADRRAGKRTLAVRFGADAARRLSAVCAIAALLAAVAVSGVDAAAAGFVAASPLMAMHMLVLLWLLHRAGAVRAGALQPAIVCALSFIMWFVLVPLWGLRFG